MSKAVDEGAALPQRWYAGLNRYQWTVLAVSCLGWMFDTLDQRLFVLARGPAVQELLAHAGSHEEATYVGSLITALFIAGWATGGLAFGILGDRLGRVRTMAATILIYSLFTGLSAFAVGPWDFAVYRFLTGLGIGGEFAAGVALVAEVLPKRSRVQALGLMQCLAVVGTFLGTGLSMLLSLTQSYAGASGWRWLFACGMLPALLLVVLRRYVKESEGWTHAKAEARAQGLAVGEMGELWRDRSLRRRTLAGMLLGFAGQLGIWGIGTWTPELIRLVLAGTPLTAQAKAQTLGSAMMLKDIGSIAGIFVFTQAASRWGRKPAFAWSFVLSIAASLMTFGAMGETQQLWWMMPLLGFTVWSALGGYAIYFPELFPTRLRATGTGVCYNVARYLTAGGILLLGQLLLLF